MSKSATEGRVSTECDLPPSDSVQFPRYSAGKHPHVRGIAAYYRLRSLALEAQVSTLEAELDRKERRLQETIARYEEILQNRPADGCVTVTQPPSDD